MKVLVVDVGGTNVKILATGQQEVRKIPSGRDLSAQHMVDQVLEASADWEFNAVSIGYPGPVINGQILEEPVNLGKGWVGYDFEGRFQRKVKLINDAAMQALGSYEGGRMLFVGLGTGMGTALIVDGVLAPLELAHLPYKKGRTFEDYLGIHGLERLGKKKWRRHVFDVVARLKAALVVHYVVIGGGNARKLDQLPEGARLGDNFNAMIGGFRLWDEHWQPPLLAKAN
jgi:predicted NBD/HSP70 family sugar kinase